MLRSSLLLLVLLAGCAAGGQWVHKAHTDPEKLKQDIAECDYDAVKATASIRSGIEAGYMQGDLRERCMTVRGYRYVRGPAR